MTQQMTRYTPADEAGMDLASLGKVLASSGYFSDTRDAAQAIVKVLAGREMGIGPIAAMTGINLIKGRVSMSANLIASQIKRHPNYDYQVLKLDDTGCELAFFERRGGQLVEIGKSAFDADDAKAAQLLTSENYKKFPRNMYFSRALTNGARWYTPDVFGGSPVYTPDELSSLPIEQAPQPTVSIVNPQTGETPDNDATIEISGVAREPESRYSKQGVHTVRFKLFCPEDEHGPDTTYTVMFVGAPDAFVEMQDGDPVVAVGVFKPFKGVETLFASAVDHAEDTDLRHVWQERAAQSGVPQEAPAAA
jgi:hypothetical protein